MITSFDVFEATNGKEGLDITLCLKPDLVITDTLLPEMDGLELCQKLKSIQSTRHIPVLFLTHRKGIEDQIRGLELGADDYITSPCQAKVLIARIYNLIFNRRKLRDHYTSENSMNGNRSTRTPSVDDFMSQVISSISTNLDDPSFGVEQLANELRVNRTTLLSRVKASSGMSPSELIRLKRMEVSKSLLRDFNLTISEIAIEVGIPEPTNFSRVFKNQFGITPSKYRGMIRSSYNSELLPK